jgi:hypothetical protein
MACQEKQTDSNCCINTSTGKQETNHNTFVRLGTQYTCTTQERRTTSVDQRRTRSTLAACQRAAAIVATATTALCNLPRSASSCPAFDRQCKFATVQARQTCRYQNPRTAAPSAKGTPVRPPSDPGRIASLRKRPRAPRWARRSSEGRTAPKTVGSQRKLGCSP